MKSEDINEKELIEKFKVDPATVDALANFHIEENRATLTRPKTPKLIFTGGQAGAGKSNITDLCQYNLKNDVVIVDADQYRGQHPQLDVIQKNHSAISSKLTHQVGAGIAVRLGSDGLKNGYNVIFDQTSRVPDGIATITKRVADSGQKYDTEFHVVATPNDFSAMRIHLRYENTGGHNGGRYVDPEFQKQSYEGLANTVKTVEADQMLENIFIYDRHGSMIFDNQLVNNEWSRGLTSHSVLTSERERELTLADKIELKEGWEMVLNKMELRNAKEHDPEIYQTAIDEIRKANQKHQLGIEINTSPELTSDITLSDSNQAILLKLNDSISASSISPNEKEVKFLKAKELMLDVQANNMEFDSPALGESYVGDVKFHTDDFLVQMTEDGKAYLHETKRILELNGTLDDTLDITYQRNGLVSANSLESLELKQQMDSNLDNDLNNTADNRFEPPNP